jgi:peptidoglycan-associated lipoprotein
MVRLRARFTLTLATLALTAACGPKRPATTPPPPVTEQPTANRDSIDAAERARRDSIAAAERERADRERRIAETRDALLAPIFFDFDSDALSDAARSSLDRKLAILNGNPGTRIRIAGHADERGSDEYNLALGQRRAAAAKRYLVQRGVGDARIDIISFGEERPAVEGSDESAWSRNRRDDFEVVSGGTLVAVP